MQKIPRGWTGYHLPAWETVATGKINPETGRSSDRAFHMPRSTRAKLAALCCGALGLVVVAAFVLFAWPQVLERYWVYRLEHGDRKERHAAAERLADLRAVDAVPRLLDSLLAEGDEAAPHLARVIQGEMPLELSRTNPLARAVLVIGRPGIIRALAHDREEARQAARSFLILSLMQEPDSLPALLEELRGEDPQVLVSAGMALYGIASSDLFPHSMGVFREALNSPHDDVRLVAGVALGLHEIDLSDRSGPVSSALRRLQEADRGEEKKKILEDLARLGPVAGEGTPAVIDLLGDEDRGVRAAAAHALGEIGAESSVPALVARLSDQDEDRVVRGYAAFSLGKIGAATDPVVPTLIKALDDRDSHVATSAQIALPQMGVAAVPGLVDAMESSDREVRRRIRRVVLEIGAPAIPPLRRAMENASAEVREEISRWLQILE